MVEYSNDLKLAKFLRPVYFLIVNQLKVARKTTDEDIYEYPIFNFNMVNQLII